MDGFVFQIDIVALRWGIGIFVFVIIAWIILARKLLKPEPKLVKVNLADRYKEVNKDILEKYNVSYEEFKKIVYQKFIDIHEALTNYNLDILKVNLTDDLYDYYVSELDKSKDKNCCNVMKDFEFINFKIYNIDDSYDLLKIDVYLNVKMIDYIIDLDTSKNIKGNKIQKNDFEFELTFIKYNNDEKMYNNYVMSKKTCVNEMQLDKNKKKR